MGLVRVESSRDCSAAVPQQVAELRAFGVARMDATRMDACADAPAQQRAPLEGTARFVARTSGFGGGVWVRRTETGCLPTCRLGTGLSPPWLRPVPVPAAMPPGYSNRLSA